MKLKSRSFECPDCEGVFTVLMEDTDPFPSFCQCCGTSMTDAPIMLPSTFRVGDWRNKTQDKVFRQMEASSIQRAKDAADMAGVPESEMAHLKITDMKDNLRTGDTSFVAPKSQVPMPSVPAQNIPLVAQSAGQATARLAMTQGAEAGPHGNMARERIVKGHAMRQAVVQRNGQEGAYSPTRK